MTMETTLADFPAPQRKALLFVLLPGAVAAALALVAAGLIGGRSVAVLTAFVALVMLLIEIGSALALVIVRPPANRGSALIWGVVLFVAALLVTGLLIAVFGPAQAVAAV